MAIHPASIVSELAVTIGALLISSARLVLIDFSMRVKYSCWPSICLISFCLSLDGYRNLLVWWWQATTASLFCGFCIKCALPNADIELRMLDNKLGFLFRMDCEGFVSSAITSRLGSSVVESEVKLMKFWVLSWQMNFKSLFWLTHVASIHRFTKFITSLFTHSTPEGVSLHHFIKKIYFDWNCFGFKFIQLDRIKLHLPLV